MIVALRSKHFLLRIIVRSRLAERTLRKQTLFKRRRFAAGQRGAFAFVILASGRIT